MDTERSSEARRAEDEIVAAYGHQVNCDCRACMAMCAALAQAVRERERWEHLLDEWEAAYPVDVFKPFTAADHPHVSPDRIAAEMGRHMVRELRRQVEALRSEPKWDGIVSPMADDGEGV